MTDSCRTFTIPSETRTLTVSGVSDGAYLGIDYLYWADSYWGDSFWGGLYWGVGLGGFNVPDERSFVVPAETRTLTVNC